MHVPQNNETLIDQSGTTLAASQARANRKITSVIDTLGYTLKSSIRSYGATQETHWVVKGLKVVSRESSRGSGRHFFLDSAVPMSSCTSALTLLSRTVAGTNNPLFILENLFLFRQISSIPSP